MCAEGLDAPFSKICRYRPAENDLLIEAGVGWKDGVVGHVVSRADSSSPQGRAFVTGEPSICNDVRKECDFALPPFYADHGIISTIDVVIKGLADQPYGVLEIDNDEQQDYDEHDIDFLIGFANVLAEAVQTSERTVVLQATIDRMKALVSQKDQLLDQKKMLAEELHHRVRNNLQLVYGMLSKQLDDTTDEAGQRGIKAIARRVSTLSQVYDQLLGTGMMRSIDFGTYVKGLTQNIAAVQAIPDDAIQLHSVTDEIKLDLDVVTALGIVVAELVTNSYDHAFPDGYHSVFHAWNRARTIAGLPDVRMHDLRHSAASNLVNSGQSLYVVGSILGHAQAKTSARYAHLANETLLAAANAAASHMGTDWARKTD